MPASGRGVTFTIEPFAGGVGISSWSAAIVHVAIDAAGPSAVLIAAASCVSSGRATPAASGPVTITSRFCAGNHCAASALISARVMPGRNRR